MFDLLDLATHGQSEEGDEVEQKNWPVNGHIGGTSDSAEESESSSLGSRVPELELCALATVSRDHVPGRRRMKGRNSSSSPPPLLPEKLFMRPLRPVA